MIDQATLQAKFSEIRPLLNERQLRLVALAEAKSLGHGGIKSVAEAWGLSRRSIERAKVEANREPKDYPGMTKQRIRRPGGGRKKLVDHQPGLLEALDRLVDPETRGDPMSPLRWTSKSTAKLAQELRNTGYKGRISEKCKRKAELLLPLRAKRGHAMANQDASAKSQTH